MVNYQISLNKEYNATLIDEVSRRKGGGEKDFSPETLIKELVIEGLGRIVKKKQV